ncbi:MAG: leucine-rich repeat domain-containing protein [Promethearchaeota archaeon]
MDSPLSCRPLVCWPIPVGHAQSDYDLDAKEKANALLGEVERALEERRLAELADRCRDLAAEAGSLADAGDWGGARDAWESVAGLCAELGWEEQERTARDWARHCGGKLRAREKVDYHGTPLYRPEHEAMVEVERLAGVPVPAVGEVEWNTFGFAAGDGHVVGLGLYDKGLASLPGTIGNLTSLKVLHLHHNELMSLPETFQFPPNLQVLSLAGNGLASLPGTIGNLTSLKVLYLQHNKLKSLPETIGKLTLLETLDLRKNQLMSLPETFKFPPNLKWLNLSWNGLTSLPGTIGDLTSLEKLNLGGNGLSSLPGTLGTLTSLKELYLDYNKLRSLPGTIGNLTSLKELHLHRNELRSLPETIGNLSSLKVLNLWGNKLKSLPGTKKKCIEDLEKRGCVVLK